MIGGTWGFVVVVAVVMTCLFACLLARGLDDGGMATLSGFVLHRRIWSRGVCRFVGAGLYCVVLCCIMILTLGVGDSPEIS